VVIDGINKFLSLSTINEMVNIVADALSANNTERAEGPWYVKQ
jgi:hypothetical protein